MAHLHRSSTIAWVGTPGYTLCIAIAAPSPQLMVERAGKALKEHLFLELRLDSLDEPSSVLGLLASLIEAHPGARLIATCRRKEAGGNFGGSVEAEVEMLASAARAGCSIVDLELESAEQMRLEQHRALRQALHEADAALLMSYHHYRATRDLEQTLARLTRHQPEMIKLVSTATSLGDSLAILRLLGGGQREIPLVAVAMGEPGLLSRVLGVRFGAPFTFASSSTGTETAPGQVAASTLRDLYRFDQITPATRIYGVAGSPIAHSLSPLLHNTGFQANGIDAVLLPLFTNSAHDLIRLVRELPLDGVAITMPLKQAILPLLDSVDPLAARIGACNTVVRLPDGSLRGYNTDLSGITVPLAERLVLKGSRVLVIGAGGAARAAVVGLLDKGAKVWIANRTKAKAEAIAAELGAQVAEDSMLSDSRFDALINATPSGMEPPKHEEKTPLAADTTGLTLGQERAPDSEAPLPARLIFDMVYRPLATPLVERARAQNRPVITGLEMFVQQGVRQHELWTGKTAPAAEMLRVVLDALGD